MRECREEGGIREPGPLYALDSISDMRSTVFAEWTKAWGPDVVVLPMYFFGMPYDGEITLSEEHLALRWLPYKQADAIVSMPDQNTALWELHERLKRGNLKRGIPAVSYTHLDPQYRRRPRGALYQRGHESNGGSGDDKAEAACGMRGTFDVYADAGGRIGPQKAEYQPDVRTGVSVERLILCIKNENGWEAVFLSALTGGLFGNGKR